MVATRYYPDQSLVSLITHPNGAIGTHPDTEQGLVKVLAGKLQAVEPTGGLLRLRAGRLVRTSAFGHSHRASDQPKPTKQEGDHRDHAPSAHSDAYTHFRPRSLAWLTQRGISSWMWSGYCCQSPCCSALDHDRKRAVGPLTSCRIRDRGAGLLGV